MLHMLEKVMGSNCFMDHIFTDLMEAYFLLQSHKTKKRDPLGLLEFVSGIASCLQFKKLFRIIY